MKLITNTLNGVLLLQPDVFEDNRGYFMESYQDKRYREFGIRCTFVQDNVSYSTRGTLRGLHYQSPHPQAKLVQVLQGEVFDVTVDIRLGSDTFGQWTSAVLSGRNRRQVYIPEGFAHGFCVLSDTAILQYKCSDFYYPEHDKGLLWSDSQLAIEWPMNNPILSKKDQGYPRLEDAKL